MLVLLKADTERHFPVPSRVLTLSSPSQNHPSRFQVDLAGRAIPYHLNISKYSHNVEFILFEVDDDDTMVVVVIAIVVKIVRVVECVLTRKS